MVLASDNVTPATGLSPTVTLNKNGVPGFAPAAGAVSEVGSGWYQTAGNSQDTAVLGPLLLHATAATANPADTSYVVIPVPTCGCTPIYNPLIGSSYITPLDLASFYDQRRVLQLAVDSTTPAVIADLSNVNSVAYGNVNRAIMTAAADIDSHAQVGQRYSPSDLQNLITFWQANPTNQEAQKGAGLIRQLTADLAFGILCGRRGYTGQTLEAYAPRYSSALTTIERLAEGYQILSICSNLQASVPQVTQIGGCVTRPSLWNRLFARGIIGDSDHSRWGQGWVG